MPCWGPTWSQATYLAFSQIQFTTQILLRKPQNKVNMVDGVNVLDLVETVLDETVHSFQPFVGSSHMNNDKDTTQNLGCTACETYFTNKSEYERHSDKNCRSDKSYPCSVCAASFRRYDHLKRHLNSVHSTSKFYMCPVCDEDCKRHDMLLKHIKSRHTDKPCIFRCRECTFECGSLSDFEKHERMHLLNERHLCPHCNTSFKRRDHMLRHVKSQHLLQYSICPICEQTFKRRDHVARHIREKHNRKIV